MIPWSEIRLQDNMDLRLTNKQGKCIKNLSPEHNHLLTTKNVLDKAKTYRYSHYIQLHKIMYSYINRNVTFQSIG